MISEWGWCSACQSVFDLSRRGAVRSCAAGGRHDPDRLTSGVSRHGRFVLDATSHDGADPALAPAPPSATHRWRFDATPYGPMVVAPAADRMPGNVLTLTFWMRPTASEVPGAVIVDHRDSLEGPAGRERGSAGFAVFMTDGRLAVQIADGDTARNVVASRRSFLDGERWYFVGIAIDRTLRLVVDGLEVHREELASPPQPRTDSSLYIGRHQLVSGASFAGTLDDIRLFDQVLGNGEIEAIRLDNARRSAVAEAPIWRGCRACGLLIHDGTGSAVVGCHAREGDAHHLDRAVDLRDEPSANGRGVAGWSRCTRCRCLFLATMSHLSVCGERGRHEADGSAYVLSAAEYPSFASGTTAGGRSVLMVALRPGSTTERFDTEVRYVAEALAGSGYSLREGAATGVRGLLDLVLDTAPAIVHLSAHDTNSDIDLDGDGLTDSIAQERGSSWWSDLEADDVLHLIAEEDVFRGVELMILNVNHSAKLGAALGTFIPAVVAVDSTVGDDAAIFFSPLFYEALAEGQTLDLALGSARRAMHIDGHFPLGLLPRLVSRLGTSVPSEAPR